MKAEDAPTQQSNRREEQKQGHVFTGAELARRRGWTGDEAEARGEDDERDPQQVSAEQMGHLHPGGREQRNVGEAKQILESEERENPDGESALRWDRQAAGDKPNNESAGDEADGRMEPANFEEPGIAWGEILRDGGEKIMRGVERVAEGSEGAGDADDQSRDEAGEGEARRADGHGSAHDRVAAGEEVRGEGECGDKEQRIGEVQAEINGAGGRTILCGMTEENEERSQQRFVEGEDEDGDGEGAGEMTTGDDGEGPEEEREHAEKVDAAGGAVGELDEGGEGSVMLQDGSVAKGPVVAASGAGAGGADGGSPDDDGDVISEDAPGEATQRGGRVSGRDGGNGGGGGHAEVRNSILVRL